MKTTKFANYVFPIFAAFMLMSGVLYAYVHTVPLQRPPTIIQSYQQLPLKYTVEPIKPGTFFNQLTIEYPIVSTPPFNARYIFVLLKEKEEMDNSIHPPLFFANKRIAELQMWGNQLNIKNEQRSVEQWIDWWAEAEPKPWQTDKYRNLSSWEANLIRFAVLVQSDIQTLTNKPINHTSVEDFVTKKKLLESYKQKIDEIINKSSKSTEEKQYLSMLNSEMITYLSNQLGTVVTIHDPTFLQYPIAELGYFNQAGRYQLSIDPKSFSEISNPIYKEWYDSENNKTILITQKEDIYKLQLPQFSIAEKKEVVVDKKQNTTQYVFDVTPLPRVQGYVLRYSPTEPINSSLKILDVTKKKPVVLFEHTFTSDGTNLAPELEAIIQLDTKKNIILTITTESELEKELLFDETLTFRPIILPTIQFTKVGKSETTENIIYYQQKNPFTYSIKLKSNDNEDLLLTQSSLFGWQLKEKIKLSYDTYQYGFVYQPRWIMYLLLQGMQLLTFFLGILVVILPFKNILFKYLINPLHKTFQTILRFTRRLIVEHKLLFVGTVFACILAQIHLMQGNIELPLGFIVTLWIIFSLLYQFSALTSFVVAFPLLTIAYLLNIIKLDVISERYAVWAFTFLMIGIVHLLLSVRKAELEVPVYKQYVTEIFQSPLVKFISNYVKKIYVNLIKKLKRVAEYIFNLRPRTFADLLSNLIKAIIVFGVMLVIGYAAIKSITYISNFIAEKRTAYEKAQIRLSLNPKVEKIEPYIVYTGNKVIMFGKGFGWQSDTEKGVVMSSNGEVRTDLWTDTKIIFTVPLEWKPGEVNMWVEKPSEWEGKKIIVVSNKVKLKLIPLSETLTPDDDAYFEQLKHLDKETLQINGYN